MPEYNEVQEDVNAETIPEKDNDAAEEPEKETKLSSSRKKVSVDVMPINLFADMYLAVAAEGYPEAYLLSKDEFDLAPGPQKIEKRVLERAPKAHDFGPELEELMPTAEDLVRAFYRAGIVDADTLSQGQRYRNALVRAMPRLGDIRAASEN